MKRLLIAVITAALVATPAMAVARRRSVAHPTPASCAPGILVAEFFSNDVGVDANYIYFGDDVNGLFRSAKDGTGVTQLASIPDGSLSLLAFDDQNLYFFSDESDSGFLDGILYSLPKSGGTPVPLTSFIPLPYDIRVDATSIYWTSLGTTPDGVNLNSDGKVEKINKDGTGRVLLASGLSGATSLGVDDTNVWFGETGVAAGNKSAGLRSVPKNGGSVTHVVDGGLVVSIELTPTDAWFSTTDANSAAGSLLRVAKSGGTPTTIYSGNATPLELRIAGSAIYYVAAGDVDETITSVPLAGGTPASLKVVQFWNEVLAIDDCAIYYPSVNGIERIGR